MTGRRRSSMNASRSTNPTSNAKKRSVSQRSPQIKRKTTKIKGDDKENITCNLKTPPRSKPEKDSSSPVTPSVTPYWKVAFDRGISPPNTRSGIKKRRESNLPTRGISGSGVLLSFSPPDHAKNAKREREELNRREKERQIRVNLARDNGQLMLFSPPHKKNRQSSRKNQTNENKNSLCLSLSPGMNLSSPTNEKNDFDDKFSMKTSNDFVTDLKNVSSSPPKLSPKDSSTGDIAQKVVNTQTDELKHSKDENQDSSSQANNDSNDNCIPEVNERLTDIQKALETMQNENHRVGAIQEMIKQSNALLQQNGQMEKEKEEFKKKIELMTEEAVKTLESHAIELSNIQKKYKEKENKMEKMKAELDTYNDQLLEQNSSLQVRIEKLENKEKELLKQIEMSNKEMEGSKNEISKAYANVQIKCRTMEETMEKMKVEIENKDSDLVDECKKLRVRNRELEKHEQDLRKKIETKSQEMEQLEKNIVNESKNLQLKFQGMEAKIVLLEKKLSEKESQLSETKQKLEAKQNYSEESANDLLQMKKSNESLSKDVVCMRRRIEELTCEMNAAEKKLASEKDHTQDIKNRLDSEMIARQIERDKQRKNVSKLERELTCSQKMVHTAEQRESSLNDKIRILDDIRRELHNKVMQLTGNIRVYIRVRGMIPCEIKKQNDSVEMPFSFPSICDGRGPNNSNNLTKHFIEAKEPHKYRGGLKERRKKWRFAFDNVFSPSNDQDDVWSVTEPLVQSTIDGYNVCLFAYGQTGSGKTHTMLGDKANPGLVSRAVKKLFAGKSETETTLMKSKKVTISVELLEIYNEQIRDLLSPQRSTGNNEIQLHQHSNESTSNILVETSCVKDVLSILEIARTRRCVKATKSNSESSRSHLIFTLHYEVANSDGIQSRGKLHICDLAGSERLSKSQSKGSLLKETQHINKSLSALSNVIENLQSKSKHIPYRDSKLTYLLRDSLGGDSKTLAIVCCNPLADNFNESLCSLRFASKANRVELKSAGNFSC